MEAVIAVLCDENTIFFTCTIAVPDHHNYEAVNLSLVTSFQYQSVVI